MIVAAIAASQAVIEAPRSPHERGAADEGVLSSYISAAMSHAIVRPNDGRMYAAIPGISAAWGRGATEAEALSHLRRSLEFIILTSVFERDPLPRFDGRSLELLRESESSDDRTLYPSADATEESVLMPFDAPDE